ncbi:hypothetical protein [Pectinatus frisingensis]|uniref:hypothetical protein n=1 Tax=Pectinatus frisingensis TaxID=865 RepID=UPI0018C496B3|nr:hypothetical protein [Pectinatus frisingensis]
MEWLSVMVQSTIVMTFIGGIFSYFILKPLNVSIQKLDRSVEKLGEKSQMMDLRLVKVEESTKSAHHRIDHLEESLERK